MPSKSTSVNRFPASPLPGYNTGMVKIKMLRSEFLKLVDDELLCCDTGHYLIRIDEANVGDHVLLTKEDRTTDEVEEVLEKLEVSKKRRGGHAQDRESTPALCLVAPQDFMAAPGVDEPHLPYSVEPAQPLPIFGF